MGTAVVDVVMRHFCVERPANRLRDQAGCNQTVEDWQRLLKWQPDGCFVGCRSNGKVVATVTTTIYCGTPRVAWVGMMLVDEQQRRRGLGRTMIMKALRWLDRNDVPVAALDATPLGNVERRLELPPT